MFLKNKRARETQKIKFDIALASTKSSNLESDWLEKKRIIP
jgi:hypothetical protein